MAKVPFGRDGCSDIEVDEFEAICSYDGIGGTDPIELSVPVPSLVPPVPPEECACLSFDSEKPVVSVVDGRAGKAWVDIESDGDCCGGSYKVTPHVEIPKCATDDFSTTWEGTLSADSDGEAEASASVKLELNVTDCTPEVVVSGKIHVPRYPALCPPAIDVTPVNLNVKYKDEEGDEKTKTVSEFLKIKTNQRTYCGSVLYGFEFGTLDLTGIGGGSASIGGGGSVFMSTDNNLYTDGSTISSTDTWYGGGFGDKAEDNPTSPYRRGWRIRGLSGPDLTADDPTPYVDIPQPYILLDDKTNRVQEWHSTRKTITADGDIEVEAGTGNLVMTIPSGFQWHEQGLALTLTTYTHNEAGLLSSAREEPYAIVVSPAPRLKVTGSVGSLTVQNISGLAMDHAMTTAEASFTDGLSVNDGYGLRIHGLDGRTVPSGDADREALLTGSLELHYGKGFRVKTIGSDGSSGYIYRQSGADGALEIDTGRGLHFTSCKQDDGKPVEERDGRIEILADATDFTFIGARTSDVENAKLAINDKEMTPVEFTDPNSTTADQIWDRTKGRELILKIRVFDSNFDNPTFLVLRYLANGVLMGCRWLWTDRVVDWGRNVTEATNVSDGCSQ